MPGWITLRFFISSTFRDMQAERDCLVRVVFPRLREELLPYRINLVDVDLRWGVTSGQDALEVCRQVIDECQPRFLGLLGGRYGWVPEGRSLSITAEEITYGVLHRASPGQPMAFFYFRDDAATASMEESIAGEFREAGGSEAAAKLTRLKDSIRESGFPMFNYPAEWDAAFGRLSGLDAFAARVHADLLRSLRTDPSLAEHFAGTPGPADPLAEERAKMEVFVTERTERYYLGTRAPLLGELLEFAVSASGSPSVLVLEAESGSGKSALLAWATRKLAPADPAPALIYHFVGATADSTDLRHLLQRLCGELGRLSGNLEVLMPADVSELSSRFRALLTEVAAQRRVVIVLDALNQLSAAEGAHDLAWLPMDVPAGARLILSTAQHPVLSELKQRGPAVRVVALPRFKPEDSRAVIEGYLRHYAKRLSAEQIALLLAKPSSGLPLYLITALEELRTLGTYEEITRRIEELPPDAEGLFRWILSLRLAHDPAFRRAGDASHAAPLVERFVSALSVSRHGVTQAELFALLDPGDPKGDVAALLRLLRPYLMPRGELIDFYHAQIRAAADSLYLQEPQTRRRHHAALAECLQRFADPHGDGRYGKGTAHALSELLYHRLQAGQEDEAVATLENVFFFEARVAQGQAFELAEDLSAAVATLSLHPAHRLLSLLEEALRRNLHFISGHHSDFPQALFQCFWNAADWRATAPTAEPGLAQSSLPMASPLQVPTFTGLLTRWREERGAAAGAFPWVRSLRPPQAPLGGPRQTVFRGHEQKVRRVAFSPDGTRVASASNDATVRLWDAQNGRQLACLRHDTYCSSVAFSPDGSTCASGDTDGGIRLWDARTGASLDVWRIECGVYDLAFSPEGGWLAIGGGDYAVHTWDLGSRREFSRLTGHEAQVDIVCYSPDGKLLLSGSHDRTLRLWAAASGRQIALLQGHTQPVTSAGFAPDGRLLFSSSSDGTVRIWTSEGAAVRTLRDADPENPIFSAALAPDGKTLLCGTFDQTLELWDLPSGLCLNVVNGHENSVSSVAFSPDGNFLLSGSEDRTMRIWSRPPEGVIAPVVKPEPRISRVAFSPTGRRVASWLDYGNDAPPEVQLWDAEAGVVVAHLRAQDISVPVVLFSPDGTLLVTASTDGSIWVWEADTGNAVSTYRYGSPVVSAVLSNDGRYLFAGLGDGTSHIRELPSGAEVVRFERHRHQVETVALAPNGEFAITGSRDHTLRLWSIRSGTQLAQWEGHTGPVHQAVFSADSCFVLSSAFGMCGQPLRLWDVKGRNQHAALPCELAVAEALAFSPDGRYVLGRFGNNRWIDSAVGIWHAESGVLLATWKGIYDLDALSARPLHSCRVVGHANESVIESATGRPIAWWPDAAVAIASHSGSRTWAVISNGRLALLRLEGDSGVEPDAESLSALLAPPAAPPARREEPGPKKASWKFWRK